MTQWNRRFSSWVIALALGTAMLAAASGVSAGNDFVAGILRVDLPEVYDAQDYRGRLLAWDKPSVGGGYTCAWLSVYLDNQPGLYGKKFTQVGLLTDVDGPRWFVYAEPGVECLRGEPHWWTADGRLIGCWGQVGDRVALYTWSTVELVHYPGQDWWIARICDTWGDNCVDVAKIWSGNTRIWQATFTMEEAYVDPDPFLGAYFYFYHPQYMKWRTEFQNWPVSTGSDEQRSLLYAYPSEICPAHYGATPNLWEDPRLWYAGTGGQTCTIDPLFPASFLYLPLVLRQYP